MDILSHGLWGGAVFEVTNLKSKRTYSFWKAFWWGMFPDLFAFTIPFIWLFWNLATGGIHLSDIPRPENQEPPLEPKFWPFALAPHLYNISHSLIVFTAVFLLVWGLRTFLKRRGTISLSGPSWEMVAWLLHIVADIPTHTYAFYPTPIFWPISQVKFSGFGWATPWFLIPDYSLLILVFLFVWIAKKRKKAHLGAG